MTFWLDWKLFGNGRGMASPYFDDAFYWLSGRFYRWTGGFGSQLESTEWFAPAPGARRRLIGREFVVFNTTRRWLRVRVTWALASGAKEYAEIDALKQRLLSWGHGL